jgi:hypothetical protein
MKIAMCSQSGVAKLWQAIFLLLIPFTCIAAGYPWAQAWVSRVIPISKLNRAVVVGRLKNKVSLVLLSKDSMVITSANGNGYLKFYVLNDADSVATISRADAALTGVTSEVMKNNQWQFFQEGINASCGNSYWSQKLAPKQALVAQYDHAEMGPIRISFRLKMTHGKQVLTSNAIEINLDSTSYKMIGAKRIRQ